MTALPGHAAGSGVPPSGDVIPRYQTPEMTAVFSDTARLARWLEIELLALDAWATLGVVPAADAAAPAWDARDVPAAKPLTLDSVTNAIADMAQQPARVISTSLSVPCAHRRGNTCAFRPGGRCVPNAATLQGITGSARPEGTVPASPNRSGLRPVGAFRGSWSVDEANLPEIYPTAL